MGKQNYKQTEVGEIPKDWGLKLVPELCENLDRLRKPVTKSKREKGVVPYYGATGVQDYVSGHLFDEDLVLVAEDCGNYKNFGQTAYTISGKSWVNNHAHILRCKNINWVFLKEMLNYMDVSKFINTGNRQKLNKSDLEKILIPFPERGEQDKIASVLSCVDSAIQQTNEIIEQTKKLKSGLMQDLLIQGVGHTEFKQTEIGKVPKDWTVQNISEVCDKPQYGYTSKSSISFDGPKYLRITDIQNDAVDWDSVPNCKIPEEDKTDYLLSTGDIVFARTGATTGKSYLIVNPPEAVFASFLIRLKARKINPEFLSHVFKSQIYWSQILKLKGDIVRGGINGTILQSILIPIPSPKEQEFITKALSSFDFKIVAEVKKRTQLEKLKRGLMQDLLTGGVRFPEFFGGGA